MGRHRIPVEPREAGGAPRPRVRRRTIAVTTSFVLAMGAGTFVVLRGGLLPLSGHCAEGVVKIAVAASPDIAPALTTIAKQARATGVKTDGRCLDVTVTSRASADVADALGKAPTHPGFQVWIPDSSVWLDQVTIGGRGTPLSSMTSIARSPVVVGTLQAQAKGLGWPAKTYTWADLTTAAGEKSNFRLGTADPARSATGLLGFTMITSSIGRRGGDVDTESAAAAKMLAQYTAPGDAQIVATLPNDSSTSELQNPQRNQALVISEQAAFVRNTAGDGRPGLKLFYPKDGSVDLDYPYAALDDDTLSTDQSRAVSRFMSLLGSDESVRLLSARGFRPATGAPDPALVVGAGGQEPQPVGAEPVPAPSGQALQQLRVMWQITVQSARITTVVDVSGSMAAPVPGTEGKTRLDVTKASLLQALTQFTPEDEVGLWRFSTRLDGSRDYQKIVETARLGVRTAQGTTQRDRLTGAFGALQPVEGGATGLYDTTLAVYQDARKSFAAGKFNTVVVLTDGANEDPGSISLDALTAKLKELGDPAHPVPLIVIAVGPDADKSACDRMARATGGAAYRVTDPAQIQAVLFKAVVAAAASAAAATG
ncbi:VWA domain-containing protein [Streptomyces sp. SID13666]|uniref:substrate-binding and VWA domain-containing protein n=1 Tax=unclassified Streptomyces TaxID=2593676 RepID=UPI0013C042C3|nr:MULTISPECIES: substrate-binding and VWA domain-containing protein [unclassified Streptomyces]NEA60087.1 VWA domain-containing protein [Streptomyces sp. SID13666]NEA75994.1 VWA domain-containing protein [Streptomyces sp. SID13588]